METLRVVGAIWLIAGLAQLVVSVSACMNESKQTQPASQPATTTTAADNTQNYLSQVIVQQVTASRIGDTALVKGELRNAGDRVLSEVAITIVFLDRDDQPIDEQRHYPVFPEGLKPTSREPLKPGYVRPFEGGFTVPKAWAGKVEVRVTGAREGGLEGRNISSRSQS